MVKTISEIKQMPINDGWGKTSTIGEIENWSGQVEHWTEKDYQEKRGIKK